jgi:hypothetical protein
MSYHSTEVQQTSTLNPASATLSCKRETVTGTNELNMKDKPPGIMRLVVKRVLPSNNKAHGVGGGKDIVSSYFGALDFDPLNSQVSTGLAKVEEEIVQQINKARNHPEEFTTEVLLPKLKRVTRTLVPSADGQWSKTKEGADGLSEAIAFSKSVANDEEKKSDSTVEYRTTLTVSAGLTLAARDHALDLGFHSLSSHRGSDQSTLQDRVGRYIDLRQGCWVTELLCFAASNPSDVVAQLFVNDGDSKRTQRSLLLHNKASHVGVALVPHRSTGYCCVVVLASKPLVEWSADTQVQNHRDFWRKRLFVESENGATSSLPKGSTCDRCRVEVDDRSTVFGPLGKRYHRQCLICRVCKSSFTHSFYSSDENEVYCGDCMKFRQCLRCFGCNAKLQSQPIHRVNDKPACQSCFTEKTALVLNSCQLRTD